MSATHTQTFEVVVTWEDERPPSSVTKGLRMTASRQYLYEVLMESWESVQVSTKLIQEDVRENLSPEQLQRALHDEAVSIMTEDLMNDEALCAIVHKMVVNVLGYSSEEVVDEETKYDLFYSTWSLIMQRIIANVVQEQYNPYPFSLMGTS